MNKTYDEKISIPKKKSPVKIIIIDNVNYIVLLSVVILVLFGIVMVFSSSYYDSAKAFIKNADENIDIFNLVKKQSLFALIGFVAMIFMANFNYRYLKNFNVLIYIVSIFFLIVVLLFGEKIKNAKRWIEIFGFNFQPSEIAKLGIIVMVAYLLSTYRNLFRNYRGYLVSAVLIFIPAILTAKEPDNSTAIVMVLVGFAMVFIASPEIKQFIYAGLLGVVGLLGYIFFSTDHKKSRLDLWIASFKDLSKGADQTIQSLYAVASGGIFGLGLGQSRQKLGALSEAQNDMIFAIICEELGFFGGGLLILIFGILIWQGIKIAINATDAFGCYLAFGITILIALQAVINISVSLNVIPNTGITLPFISSGGTSLIMFMAMSGILLNISRYSNS